MWGDVRWREIVCYLAYLILTAKQLSYNSSWKCSRRLISHIFRAITLAHGKILIDISKLAATHEFQLASGADHSVQDAAITSFSHDLLTWCILTPPSQPPSQRPRLCTTHIFAQLSSLFENGCRYLEDEAVISHHCAFISPFHPPKQRLTISIDQSGCIIISRT